MSRRPRFKPQFQVRVLEPDAVYLLSETRNFVLNGRLYAQLARFLDGTHTVDEISAQLGTRSDRLTIELAIARLVGRGFVTYDEVEPSATYAFWDLLGINPQLAVEHLASARVAVTHLGDVSPDPLVAALQNLGIDASIQTLEKCADFSLVAALTDDYLRPGLEDVNLRFLDRGQMWMLVKPIGVAVWVGPMMVPGTTACWQCLAGRLLGNRPIETFVNQRIADRDDSRCTSVGTLPTTETAGIQLAATEIAKQLALGDLDEFRDGRIGSEQATAAASISLLNRLVTLDTAAFETFSHKVIRRPQCAACGTENDPTREPEPIWLETRKKLFTSDGGHRICTPEETIRRYEYHLSPVTGIVNSVNPIPHEYQDVVRCYQSVVPFGLAREYRQSFDMMHRRCQGKGKTDRQAWASAFCEAIERYSAVYTGETEIRHRHSYEELGTNAVHPRDLLLLSEKQYAEREKWNDEHPSDRYWTPPLFDNTKEVDWTPAWSLTNKRFRYLPTAHCYFAYPISEEERFSVPDSNGIAAGNNREEAILQGLLEVVERDAVALWWYNKLQRPAVDLSTFNDPFLEDLREVYADMGRDFQILDITTDLGIPSFAALSARREEDLELIAFGFGTHVDPHVGILRAATEMNQFTIHADQTDWARNSAHNDQVRMRWMREIRIADNPYLAPAPNLPAKQRADYAYVAQDDLRVDIENCTTILAEHGLEALVLDLTKPDVGMSVVRVVVPGLRPNTRSLAPGRLYDVPVQLGWLTEPRRESEMNSVPMFF